MSTYVADGEMEQIGYEQLTVSSTAVGFTLASHQNSNGVANTAVIRLTGAGIRYLFDGVTDPTASTGMPWEPEDLDLVITIKDLTNFKMIRSTGSDATADILYLTR